MTPDWFPNVSRETLEKLDHYVATLIKWTPKINLVAKSTLDDVWNRHVLDSAQVFSIRTRDTARWVDLGSGGGFPGMVVAVLAHELLPSLAVTLVESDVRKCAFLMTVARELGLQVHVENNRVENLERLNADTISARALADLDTLFELSQKHIAAGGQFVFLKGKKWKSEVERAQSKWHFDYQVVKSKTSEGSVIICASGVRRV